MATREEIAWAAGLFEGEGSAFIASQHRQPKMTLVMTDQDVVERFQRVMGVGQVRTYGHNTGGRRKPYWMWTVQSRADVLVAASILLPHLGRRRTAAVLEVQARARERYVRDRATHCRRGLHEFTPENTYIKPSGHRMCRACMRDTARRWQASHRGA
jgi:hypothetical protein